MFLAQIQKKALKKRQLSQEECMKILDYPAEEILVIGDLKVPQIRRFKKGSYS